MPQRIRKILITGGAGFIGSECVRLLSRSYRRPVVIDSLTYAGDKSRLKGISSGIKFRKLDITQTNRLAKLFQKERPDAVLHFAAETHVDRSIHTGVEPFIRANITGTQNLIDICRKHRCKRFVHISTDEVYGDHSSGRFREEDTLRPNNPYAATKAAAEHLVRAAVKTYDFPALIIRPCNNYGPWQYPEKFVPVIIHKASRNQKIPVYGRGKQVREWLYVSDCARAIQLILKKGRVGEIYNIGSYNERPNIETVKAILKIMRKPQSLIKFVKDRPGHDYRYSVDCRKLRKLGWKPRIPLHKGLRETIRWYGENEDWVETKLSDLKKYWKKIYKP